MEPAKAADLVRKLRAKAASTTFPEEKKLLTAKADKLARKYRVDEAPRRRRPSSVPPDIWTMTRDEARDYLRHHYGGNPWRTFSDRPTAAENGPFSGATGDVGS